MKTRKISIASQLFIFILGAAIVVALIVGGVSYGTMGNFLREKNKLDVMEIASMAAQNVDGETFAGAVEGNEEALLTVKDSLNCFLEGDSVAYVYTLMPTGANSFAFVVDTDPEDPGEYGEDYEVDEAMYEAICRHCRFQQRHNNTEICTKNRASVNSCRFFQFKRHRGHKTGH